MSFSKKNHDEWLKYPTGKISKGEYCECCARFNVRPTACNSVIIIDNKILLIKRAMEPQKNRWDIPGGYLDWDETLHECCSRELKEETGLIVEPKNWEFFYYFSNPDNSVGNQVIDLYFKTDAYTGDIKLDSKEALEYRWFSLTNLPEDLAFDHREALETLV
jgi:ADP-ribose pyrophosphatase YjhB (NUDIX family)